MTKQVTCDLDPGYVQGAIDSDSGILSQNSLLNVCYLQLRNFEVVANVLLIVQDLVDLIKLKWIH